MSASRPLSTSARVLVKIGVRGKSSLARRLSTVSSIWSSLASSQLPAKAVASSYQRGSNCS